jgi:excisionase family DNA binding protein
VAEVAEQLGVCAATVYRLCESGELPHVRIVNSIRVRPTDLEALVATRVTAAPPL